MTDEKLKREVAKAIFRGGTPAMMEVFDKADKGTQGSPKILSKRGAVPIFYSCKQCTWLGPQLAMGGGGRGVCPNCGARSLGVHIGERDWAKVGGEK